MGVGVGGKPKAGNTIHKETNSSAVSSVGHRNCHSQPGLAQTVVSCSFDTPNSLISAHHWPHRRCSGPSWFYRVGKKTACGKQTWPSIALLLACLDCGLNVATMLNNKLDFR